MIQAAETVYQDLAAIDGLGDFNIVGVYWEMAPDKAKAPFLVFRLRENKRTSKDNGGNYDLKVFCIAKSMKQAAEISEVVKPGMISQNHRYQFGESGYNDTEAKEAFIELNFNFNL